jgi:hypothetical protein
MGKKRKFMHGKPNPTAPPMPPSIGPSTIAAPGSLTVVSTSGPTPDNRRPAFEALQKARSRPLISYVTSKRANLQTYVTGDVVNPIYEHLRRIKNPPVDEIDFFLITLGGDVTVPLPIQRLLREYAGKVNILVPAECYSAGTMIALGADSIVMAPLGQLSPIDPTVNHPLGPLSNEPPVLQPDGTKERKIVGGLPDFTPRRLQKSRLVV